MILDCFNLRVEDCVLSYKPKLTLLKRLINLVKVLFKKLCTTSSVNFG